MAEPRIDFRNRVPLENRKNNVIRTNLSTSLTLAELIQALNNGLYADISYNNATSGDNAGVVDPGVELNKATMEELTQFADLRKTSFKVSSNKQVSVKGRSTFEQFMMGDKIYGVGG